MKEDAIQKTLQFLPEEFIIQIMKKSHRMRHWGPGKTWFDQDLKKCMEDNRHFYVYYIKQNGCPGLSYPDWKAFIKLMEVWPEIRRLKHVLYGFFPENSPSIDFFDQYHEFIKTQKS